jgi:hypothetical protein
MHGVFDVEAVRRQRSFLQRAKCVGCPIEIALHQRQPAGPPATFVQPARRWRRGRPWMIASADTPTSMPTPPLPTSVDAISKVAADGALSRRASAHTMTALADRLHDVLHAEAALATEARHDDGFGTRTTPRIQRIGRARL